MCLYHPLAIRLSDIKLAILMIKNYRLMDGRTEGRIDGWTGKARNINTERPKLVSSINSDMHVLADYLKCKIIIIIQRERDRERERQTKRDRQTDRN